MEKKQRDHDLYNPRDHVHIAMPASNPIGMLTDIYCITMKEYRDLHIILNPPDAEFRCDFTDPESIWKPLSSGWLQKLAIKIDNVTRELTVEQHTAIARLLFPRPVKLVLHADKGGVTVFRLPIIPPDRLSAMTEKQY